jgi:hypothetical protein
VSQSAAAYESAARNKLRLGLTRLARAGHDTESLGFALTSLHEALEDHTRSRLGSHPDIPSPLREDLLEQVGYGWPKLIDLLKVHDGLSRSDAQLILHANNLSSQFAHSGEFRGNTNHVRTYAHLVQTMILGSADGASTTSVSAPAAPPRSTASQLPPAPPALPDTEPLPPMPPLPSDVIYEPSDLDEPRRRPSRRMIVRAACLALGLAALALMLRQIPLSMMASGFDAFAPTGAAPMPTPIPVPAGAFWVKNHRPTEMWSGPAGQDGVVSFGITSGQFCSFLVVRPQDNPRLYVLNPYSNNYLWIDADAVGPSAAPEQVTSPRPANQNCTGALHP